VTTEQWPGPDESVPPGPQLPLVDILFQRGNGGKLAWHNNASLLDYDANMVSFWDENGFLHRMPMLRVVDIIHQQVEGV
jgi:hypothetical protein